MPAILNAANEVAVQAFLDRELNFLDIPRVIEAVITQMSAGAIGSLEDVLAADAEARQRALERLATPHPAAMRAAI
jgi:1-deoxy-D-xylulose-5-phosphate reductoisomerase